MEQQEQQQLSNYEKHKSSIKAWYDRHKDDPEFRKRRSEKQAAYRRLKYQTDPAYKEKQREEARKRYHAVCKNNEEFMKRNRERALESYYKRKAAAVDVDDATVERILGVNDEFFLDDVAPVEEAGV